MKIINRKELGAELGKVIYSKYYPCTYDSLFTKGKILVHDLLYQQIIEAIDCEDAEEYFNNLGKTQNISLKTDFVSFSRGQDGNEEHLLAVWEKDDVESVIEGLKNCLGETYRTNY